MDWELEDDLSSEPGLEDEEEEVVDGERPSLDFQESARNRSRRE